MTPKRFAVFLAVSLLLHLVLVGIIAVGWVRYHQSQPDPPMREKIRITFTPRQQPAPLPKPLERPKPFVDTSQSIRQEEPNPEAAFQGAENTIAQSREAGSGMESLPNLTGENQDSLNLRNSEFSPQIQTKPAPQSPEQEERTEKKKAEDQDQEKQEELIPSRTSPLTRDRQGLILTREEQQKRQELLEEKRKELEALDAQQRAQLPPMAFSAERRQSAIQGGARVGELESFGAEQTELGRYKQKLYRAVGSRWYIYVDQARGLVSLGKVRIRFFVRSDGVFEQLEVTHGDRASQLYAISRRSIMEVSGQLEPFSERMKSQLGDGYWEEISFTIR